MNNTDAIEQAYRNGYEDGKRDAVKHGVWIPRLVKYGYSAKYYVAREQCSICKNFEQDMRSYCPNCGAKMDGEPNA